MLWSLCRCTCALLSASGSCAAPTEAPSSRWGSTWERWTICCLRSTPAPSRCCTARPHRAPGRRLSKLSGRIWAKRYGQPEPVLASEALASPGQLEAGKLLFLSYKRYRGEIPLPCFWENAMRVFPFHQWALLAGFGEEEITEE